MQTLDISGAQLKVLDQGQGPVVVFVHGFPLTHAMWQPQIEALAADYRIIAPDLRGFGESSATRGTVTMRQFADDLAGILDALNITEPVTFCGLSMGGYIGWQFVQNYPDRLKSLVCCDTKASADSDEAIQNRHKLAASVLKHGVGVLAQAMPEKLFAKPTLDQQDDIVEQCKQMMLAADPEGTAAALRGMAERPNMTPLLATIQVPTLVI
ncbi:MAG: alpha/beta fold hydrolase, partial [Planctomycetaceae bacterium]|nr:alpha/beta fold hydrolase [Planctomycetaceae bacterium]